MSDVLPWWLIVPLVGLLGALIGSFLNVVVWRVPQGMSIVHPPSACPECGHRIAWHDNVPVVSWLLLRGRCRSCGARISVRYPLVEAGTAVAFALTAWGAYALLADNRDMLHIDQMNVTVGDTVGAGLRLSRAQFAGGRKSAQEFGSHRHGVGLPMRH